MTDSEVKEKILRGAEDLFLKYGVRSISMDDIARHLTVSKKTLYQHFSDKEELVFTVCRSHMTKNRIEFEEIKATAKNAIDELVKISRCLKKTMEETNPSLLFDLQKYHPSAWQEWVNYKHQYIKESVIKNLKQGIEEGYFRTDLNPEILAKVRIELVQLGFDEGIFPRSKFQLAEVQLQIFDHFVYGLVTEKGRKLYLKYKAHNLQPSTV